MTETFFGPWRVMLKELAFLDINERFVISGSDAADGIYTRGETPIDIAVSGAEWSIDTQVLFMFPPGSDWVSRQPFRITEFVVPQGLAVRLNFDPDPAHRPTDSDVLCISMDPEINPPATPNPFDFTLPKG